MSVKELWCENQFIDENGAITCSAHAVEMRTFTCPYKDKTDRASSKYPCSDYKEAIAKQCAAAE